MSKKLLNFIDNPYQYLSNQLSVTVERIPITYTPWAKKTSNNKYSIVSSVYGVEPYLDQFFKSITNQTLLFENHIELIIVDDGSLDDSADIIKRWQERYPDNIKYIHKKNGGQASARNVGMEYVTNNWVTFIDPDDFISKNYFERVDSLLSSQNKLAMVSCNFIFYMEATNTFKNTHPLSYRFEKDISLFTLPEVDKHLQLSVNSAFFRADIIKNNKLSMDSRIKPNFEDAHFVGKYLLSCKDKQLAFIKKAKYFYRKRQNNTSTLDTSWESKRQYAEKLQFGDLDLLEFAEKNGAVIPPYIQRTVLYDLIWYFRNLVNNKEKLSFLTADEKAQFVVSLKRVFRKIDTDTILNFELVSCDAYYKVGWLSLFKDTKPPAYDIEVEAYDDCKKQIKLHYYYSGSACEEVFKFDEQDGVPIYAKVREHDFLGHTFVLERVVWLSIRDSTEYLSAFIEGKKANLLLGKERYEEQLSIETIVDHFDKTVKSEKDFSFGLRVLRLLARLSSLLPGYQDAWVFMDRDIQADDNAEHLYRYIHRENPTINARFLLRKSSHDWDRLKKDGFRLIPFGSIRHMILLFNAKHLISSHLDNYVVNFPPYNWFKGILKYRFTFLQHGIIKHDLSKWLNIKRIDILVTTSEQEYQSIAGERGTYKFTPKEVCLTGLARHDELLRKAKKTTKNTSKGLNKTTLLIMPTWRQTLVGKTHWMSNERKINNEFYSSEYALVWKQFLHSDKLRQMVNDHNLEVIFFPHANVSPYLDWFDVPSYITSLEHKADTSMQDVFVQSSILLTDYSSVAFEMAYLEKPVIYYQFDRAEVFGGGHMIEKGYFDYEKDAFGPICDSAEQIFSSLKNVLESHSSMDKEYLERVYKTFKFRDEQCCQRIYDAIIDLENSDELGGILRKFKKEYETSRD